MKRISYILIGAVLFLQSCLKEDLSICQSELSLKFLYTLNDQYTNLFDAEVNRITVYIFDNNGKYVDTFSEEGDKLTNDYVMHIPLPAGKYSIVAYGGHFTTFSAGELDEQTNILNPSLRKGVTDIKKFRAELKSISDQYGYLHPIATPDDMYAGLAIDVVSAAGKPKITDVELIKDTKKIKVKITGISTILGPLDVYITALNGRYNFDNNLDSNHGTFKYTPINSSVQSDYMEVDLKMMRLMLGQSPTLVIRNSSTSEVIYNANMIDLIKSTGKYLSQEDFDREDEFVFEIGFKSTNQTIGISISINGWKINNVNTDA